MQIFPPTVLNMMGGTKVLPLYKKEEHAKNVQNIEITTTKTYIQPRNFAYIRLLNKPYKNEVTLRS